VQAGDLAKARQEINRSPSDFSSFILGQVLLREGKVEEAMPRLQPISAGKVYELLRDCRPDASTPKCAATVKQSEESFQSIPDGNAWYVGASTFALLGQGEPAVRLLNAASERNFCTFPSVDRDPLFDGVRQKDSFKKADGLSAEGCVSYQAVIFQSCD
jgi:hypothetical protein